MRPILATALLVLAAPVLAQGALPGAPQASRIAAGTYPVDPAHTQVTWQVNHMGFSMLQGQFGASAGQITIDPAKPNATKVEVTFQTDQLTTTAPRFTDHLKSKDFFDVANHPTARFVSTAVRATGDKATITGNLTIKGITKPVTLQATFVGAGANPMNKKLNFGFRATGTINRSDFGLGMATPVVSDKVDLTINAAFAAA
ncbi:YceI family protein [Sphingomonas rubra]|uniref:Polyisoprenoid-binding protein YceI n=1 Tax=Sphingomonas rubra TaxID=634430 RepID=A0A1I5QST3_9SPHN|nr:YceI family protein [Sphingomonas rubra]SFP49319.1 Polyisoprenoid-binding protein YceI [Sphingomonas rubra]